MDSINDDKKIEPGIEEIKKQCDEYLNGWKRAKADLINFQNEMVKERTEWIRFSAARAINNLLPALDALNAAALHSPELAAVIRKFDEFLKTEDVTEIATAGHYDPLIHEVVGREKNETAESGLIIAVVQKGYRLQDRVLRPAKVIIAE